MVVRARQRARRAPPRRSTSRDVAAAAVAESARSGLPRRPGAGRRVRLAAAQRPGLELRRQQLPARQGAAGVRHPLLEPGHRPARRRPAPRLHPASGSTTRSRTPGALEVLGTPVDLGRGRRRQLRRRRARPTTSSRGRTPTAARSCSAATPRFVLSTSGHIQALVNPPGPESRVELPRRRRAARRPARRSSRRPPTLPGSWWPDYDAWLAERSGALKAAPKTLGNRTYRAQGKAPGTYVLAN